MDLIEYWLLYKRIMKVAFFTTLTFLLLFGCSETPEYQGTYSGILVMDDGISEVELLLSRGGEASLSGFHETQVEGEWKAEMALESKRPGLWATFVLPTYRIRFELSSESEGLRVQRISLRMKGKTILRTLQLKKAKPLLIRQ